MEPVLRVVMYHYVRDLPRTRFPRINGMLTSDFRAQARRLAGAMEMATSESALAFLDGKYKPKKDLCLLSFDDGFKEHCDAVTPILAERGIQGVFFLITSATEEKRVASVHKNHFLMAAMEFAEYRDAFLGKLRELAPGTDTTTDPTVVAKTYRWDKPEVGAFKFILNFKVDPAVKDRVLDELFTARLGDERAFAEELYLSWDEARKMQRAGMSLGGHTHSHQSLSTLSDDRQEADLRTCMDLLRRRLSPQTAWPFSYPYGKTHTFNGQSVRLLKDLGFSCGFSTEVGDNAPGQDRYRVKRVDPKDV
jgi:peptidoglycan/xylan/chitin deacetylase (PgdA/CDA1 family)